MIHTEIRDVRVRLGLTQESLAQLVGVHPMTVSKWERGALRPGPFQGSLLSAASIVAAKGGYLNFSIASTLARYGVARALYQLLQAAYG